MIILFKVHKSVSLVSFQWNVLLIHTIFAAELYHISEKDLSKLRLIISFLLALSFKVDLFMGEYVVNF